MRLLRRFLLEELVPHPLEVSGSVQTSGRDCSGDSFQRNWSHTLWRCLGVCRRPDEIALEIPSGRTGPTLSGGVWECADVWTRLLWRFLPEELVPHSLEVSGSVQTSGRDCSGDSFWRNWSHTCWRCLGVCSHPDKIALEIPSRGTGPTLSGGVWECAAIQTRLLWRFILGELVPHSLEVSGSVQPSRQDCSADSFWRNWSHTLWRCLGVCSHLGNIALEIPSGGTGPTLSEGVWECAAIQMRLLQRFLLEELVPHSLEVSGSVQMSGRDCSRDSFWRNWSHTLWRCLGVCSCLDKIALEIPSGGTGPTLSGGVWECAAIWTRLLRRFLLGELVPHSLEVSGSVQPSGRHCSRDSFWGNLSHTLWRCLGVCSCPDEIAPEIPSGGTGPTLSGGVWECAAIWTRLLQRFLLEELVPHSLEVSEHAAIQTTLLRRFLPEELVPHSLEVSERAAIWTRLLWRFLLDELVPHSLDVSGSVQLSR